MTKKLSLRKCVNDKCRDCTYDPKAAGTWLQQVTICAVKNCALYPVRPVSKSPIPESVMDYYGITGAERALYRLSRPPEGPFAEHDEVAEYNGTFSKTIVKKGPNRGGSR